MASRFYVAWPGSKRQEIHHIDAVVDWGSFDSVVEPFAGSAALSLELHARGLDKQYVVNDADPNLVALYRYAAEHGSAPLYDYCRARLTAEEFDRHHGRPPQSVEEYFYTKRVPGAFGRAKTPPPKWPSLTHGTCQLAADRFFGRARITEGDWRTCVDEHKDDPRALIFLDPPYFDSFNQAYYGLDGSRRQADGSLLDLTGMFVEMLHYLETAQATVVVITSGCALLDHVFAPFIKSSHIKRYSRASTRPDADGKMRKTPTRHTVLLGGRAGAGE